MLKIGKKVGGGEVIVKYQPYRVISYFKEYQKTNMKTYLLFFCVYSKWHLITCSQLYIQKRLPMLKFLRYRKRNCIFGFGWTRSLQQGIEL